MIYQVHGLIYSKLMYRLFILGGIHGINKEELINIDMLDLLIQHVNLHKLKSMEPNIVQLQLQMELINNVMLL